MKANTEFNCAEYGKYSKKRKTFYTVFLKRFFDIFFSLIGIVIALPLFVIFHIAVLIDVGFPIIFKQVRIGVGCRPFVLYKYRNMTNETDENGVLLPGEKRITKFGKIFRATSLDEIPQLFNILKGDMSFIGPRPLPDYYLPLYSKKHLARHNVKPGLECPQWKKIDHFRTWPEQFDNDVWYAEHCSLWVDIVMIFKLVAMVFAKNPDKATDRRPDPENENK